MITLISIYIVFFQGEISEDDKKKFVETGKKCQDECKASVEDMQSLMKYEEPKTEEENVFQAGKFLNTKC